MPRGGFLLDDRRRKLKALAKRHSGRAAIVLFFDWGMSSEAFAQVLLMDSEAVRDGYREWIKPVPDSAFSLELQRRGRRNVLVEIDRGTMSICVRDFHQTSFEQKIRSYLSTYFAKLHERRFG